MDIEPKYKEYTPFEYAVEWLLQKYIDLESFALSNNTDECLRIVKEIDKTYEKILDIRNTEIRESDLWLYDNLKHAHKARIGMNDVFNHLTDELMDELMYELNEEIREKERFKREGTKTLLFNKENGGWYIHLPDYLEMGLVTKADLMMVDGADTFLDMLSNNGTSVKVKVSINVFDGFEAKLIMINKGKNQQLLEQIGHASVDYGAYYKVEKYNGADSNHILWLCPVTEYVFGGSYPDKIWLKIIN